MKTLTLQSQKGKGFLGRVARRRSAKPFTAVRIRQEPLSMLKKVSQKDTFFF